MADVSTTHQVVNRSNMQDLVISKLEFIRLSATSGQISIYVTAETEGGNKGIYGPIDADAGLGKAELAAPGATPIITGQSEFKPSSKC